MTVRRNGFTLIEVIGVLAIIAILASAIAPNIAHEIKRTIIEAEDRSLATITDALRRTVIESHVVPGVNAGQWDAAVAPYLNLPSSEIIRNRGSGSRRLISRPTNGLGGAPYDQATSFAAGATPQGTLPASVPLQARMFIVSNLDGAPPATALSDVQFDAVWDQAGAVPNGFIENNEVRIGRCGFAGSFCPITVNCPSVANNPAWSLDAMGARSLTLGPPFTVYLIVGTRVNLLVNNVVQETVVADRSRSFTYNGTAWSY